MLGRFKKSRQLDIFGTPIKRFVNSEHELVLTAGIIPWEKLENQLKRFYSSRGRPSIPLRKVLGLLLLKDRFSVGDEKALNIWLENPYWQYFCGEVYFQKEKPYSLSELTRFRKRIGSDGEMLIHQIIIEYFGGAADNTYAKYSDRYAASGSTSIWNRIRKQLNRTGKS